MAGIKPLREAIAAKLRRDNELGYAIDQITVGCGAKQVVFNALFASLNPGAEVIVPTPSWVSYPHMVRLAGGHPVLIPCTEDNGFKLSAAQLRAAVTPRTRWLVLNSPNNPTGAVYDADELRALAAVLEDHPQVWVLSDDIYEKLIYEPARFATMASAAPALFDRTLTLNGVSKVYASTGWRVGYGAGPADLIKAMNTIQGQTSSHTSSVSQHAALEAIAGDQSYIPTFVGEFQSRRDFLVDRLNRIPGLQVHSPAGTFYAFASCADLIGRRMPNGGIIATDADLAMYLLDQARVAVVPGSAFSASPYIRFSYACSAADLARACDAIAAALVELC